MTSIIFSKPDYKKLRRDGFLCADMHFHSVHSDGSATIGEILEKAGKLGSGVAITDHNVISGALEAWDNKKDLLIVPGIEVKSSELVDVLFYFYDTDTIQRFFEAEIRPFKEKYFHITKLTRPLEEIVGLKSKYRCIMSVPHPFGYTLRGGMDVIGKYGDILDKSRVFEAINGGNSRSQNMMAVDYIKTHNKEATGGTDGHSIYPLGNIATCAQAKTLAEFLDQVSEGKAKVIGLENTGGKFGEYGRYAFSKIKGLFK